MFGGGDGACAESVIIRADGTEQIIPSKIVTRLMRGDRVVVKTAGGAGYGDPAARDPARSEADVADGVV
jgi:N-methylhydantoinase B/oxoprolinase/acetone carboxylase alpha subunit